MFPKCKRFIFSTETRLLVFLFLPSHQHVSTLFLTVAQDTGEGMLRGQFKAWVDSAVLATAFLGWSAAVLALPHQVVPVPATTDALSLVLYVKSSEIPIVCVRVC